MTSINCLSIGVEEISQEDCIEEANVVGDQQAVVVHVREQQPPCHSKVLGWEGYYLGRNGDQLGCVLYKCGLVREWLGIGKRWLV